MVLLHYWSYVRNLSYSQYFQYIDIFESAFLENNSKIEDKKSVMLEVDIPPLI